MIALIVSYLILAYLLVPRGVFRLADLVVPLKFQRTRSEELTFAILVSTLPFFLALIVAVKIDQWPSATTLSNYKTIFSASYSDAFFEAHWVSFWAAIQSTFVGQEDFLCLYYLLVFVEMLIFAFLVTRYGRWRNRCCVYDWIAGNVFLRGVNEWHMLLTSFDFPPVPARQVVADVLTQEDHLYQGVIADHFVDPDGSLSGLSLKSPRRFDRAGYLKARENDKSIKPDPYWRDILGAALYIPREKILTLNLRYPPVESRLSEAGAATQELNKSGIQLQLEESEQKPSS
jgi:hypothetical protein